jgi:TPR repeat protein
MDLKKILSLAHSAEACDDRLAAFSAYVAAAIEGHWDSWLSASLVLEERTGFDTELTSFFRKRYLTDLVFCSENGDIEAMRRLAGFYEFGKNGCGIYPERAIDLWKQAASLGDSASMFELYEKYMYGLCGVSVDEAHANSWLRSAAKSGHPEAISIITASERPVTRP